MFDKFCDYMYYLLIAPFKKVRKTINQWYILFRVLGKRFDDGMESLYNARDQTMLATCNPEILPVHAEDRKMTRYPGEEDENFRARIANYPEVLRLGGTDRGVLLAVETLGYTDVKIVLANNMLDFFGEERENRWAEFYVVIMLQAGKPHPVSFSILKNEVRKVKYVTAKDNYYFIYRIIQKTSQFTDMHIKYKIKLYYWKAILLDGSIKLDGSVTLNSVRTSNNVRIGFFITFQHKQKINTIIGGNKA